MVLKREQMGMDTSSIYFHKKSFEYAKRWGLKVRTVPWDQKLVDFFCG